MESSSVRALSEWNGTEACSLPQQFSQARRADARTTAILFQNTARARRVLNFAHDVEIGIVLWIARWTFISQEENTCLNWMSVE